MKCKLLLLSFVIMIMGVHFSQQQTAGDSFAAVVAAAIGFVTARKAQQLEE